MAFYSICFRTSAGDELLYEGDGDQLMQELSRIRKSFGKKKITGFEIFDSFQYAKEKKFSIEFLEANVIEVTKIEEEENEL